MMVQHDRECPRRQCFTFCGELCDCGADDMNSIITRVTAGFRQDVAEIMKGTRDGQQNHPD